MQRSPTLVERFFAEALGTFLLTFIGAGAAAELSQQLHATNEPFTNANFLLVALAHGFALFIAVIIIGKISGVHVNPAVTLGLASIGRIPYADVPAYIVGQFIGAIIAALGILVVYGKNAATIGNLGAPSLSFHTGVFQGMVIEAIGAFILVLAVIGAAVDSRAPSSWAGLTIGLALAAIIMGIGPPPAPP